MASQMKKIYTGLAGLPINETPQRELIKLYKRITNKLKVIPKESAYRAEVEKYVAARLAIVESTSDRDEIEKKVNSGLCEELIEEAKAEIKLIETMNVHKPWEPLVEKPGPDQWKWPM